MFLTDLPKRSKTSQLHHRVFLFYRSELNTSAIQYCRWWGCGEMWLLPLTTASKAPNVLSAIVIILAPMQCILNLIVHNLPSLTVRKCLWLWDMGTLTDIFQSRRTCSASCSLSDVPDGLAQDVKDISAPSQGLCLLFLSFVASHIRRHPRSECLEHHGIPWAKNGWTWNLARSQSRV